MAGLNSLPPPSSKKLKTSSSTHQNVASSSRNRTQRVVERITSLEQFLADALRNNGSLNALADLLQIATASSVDDGDEEDEVLVKAIFALYRSFVLVSQKGVLGSVPKGSEGEDVKDEEEESGRKAVKSWVISRLDTFTELLAGLLQDENKIIRVCVLH